MLLGDGGEGVIVTVAVRVVLAIGVDELDDRVAVLGDVDDGRRDRLGDALGLHGVAVGVAECVRSAVRRGVRVQVRAGVDGGAKQARCEAAQEEL